VKSLVVRVMNCNGDTLYQDMYTVTQDSDGLSVGDMRNTNTLMESYEGTEAQHQMLQYLTEHECDTTIGDLVHKQALFCCSSLYGACENAFQCIKAGNFGSLGSLCPMSYHDFLCVGKMRIGCCK